MILSSSEISPIYLLNFFNKDDPRIVVIMTIVNDMVMIYFLSLLSICKHKAKAIAPRIMPLNQHILTYFMVSGSLFLVILYHNGKM